MALPMRAWLLSLSLGLASLAMAALPVRAQPPVPVIGDTPAGVRVIEISGEISQKHVLQFRRALESADPNRFPAGAILLLDSPGGDVLAAMEIGRIARTAGAHAFVRGHCNSACVLILAGSLVRGVDRDRAVAIHRGRITISASGATLDFVNPEAAYALEVADRLMAEYLREMDMPPALFRAIMTVPANLLRHLTLAEMTELRLLGMDPGWRRLRVPVGATTYGISPEEFERRLQLAPAACIPGQLAPQDFARCYRRVMQAGA
jgi:ATP-dependent protease ClpP protease subunit